MYHVVDTRDMCETTRLRDLRVVSRHRTLAAARAAIAREGAAVRVRYTSASYVQRGILRIDGDTVTRVDVERQAERAR